MSSFDVILFYFNLKKCIKNLEINLSENKIKIKKYIYLLFFIDLNLKLSLEDYK